MHECARCGGTVEAVFRFCPWCAAPQRSKLVDFFPAHPRIVEDRGKALRVSRYLGGDASEWHARFSVWGREGEAFAAVSLDERETRRLAAFLADPAAPQRVEDEETLALPPLER